MGEKKFVLKDLRISYNGYFDVQDFFSDVYHWLDGKGYKFEPKKYQESITEHGKKIEWVIEAHKHYSRHYVGVLRLRMLGKDFTQTVVKVRARKHTVISGDVLVWIDAYIDSHIAESSYHERPLFFFIVGLIDKFITNFWSEKYDGEASGDGHALYKQVRSFFSISRYTFQDTVSKEK